MKLITLFFFLFIYNLLPAQKKLLINLQDSTIILLDNEDTLSQTKPTILADDFGWYMAGYNEYHLNHSIKKFWRYSVSLHALSNARSFQLQKQLKNKTVKERTRLLDSLIRDSYKQGFYGYNKRQFLKIRRLFLKDKKYTMIDIKEKTYQFIQCSRTCTFTFSRFIIIEGTYYIIVVKTTNPFYPRKRQAAKEFTTLVNNIKIIAAKN